MLFRSEYIRCDIIPREINCCHLLLGKPWCDKFQINFDSGFPDPEICWNKKHTWLARSNINSFLDVNIQNLCLPEIKIAKTIVHEHVTTQISEVHTTLELQAVETCEVSTNIIISTPSVVSCDMQVPFEIGRAHV